MNMMNSIVVALLTALLLSSGGCSTRELATGAAAGGAAYEYSNKRAMDQLREDYEDGEITSEEYERRKDEIEDRSLVY